MRRPISVTLQQADALKVLLSETLPEGARAWLEESGGVFEAGTDLADCFARFAEVTSRVGRESLAVACGERDWQSLGLSPGVGAWSLDECGRALLLVRAAAHLPEDRLAELVEGCYFQGETRERQGVVRGLWYLPRTDRLLQIGLDAGRTHIQPLFEALACENAFPAEALPDTSFHHLVLKALFTEVRLPRIVGLSGRISAELRRMVADFVDERRAAGRPVPADVVLIGKDRRVLGEEWTR